MLVMEGSLWKFRLLELEKAEKILGFVLNQIDLKVPRTVPFQGLQWEMLR
jgi:hypothetical protein